MSFAARCPNCHRETLAPDEDIGRAVRCHGCAAEFVLVPELAVATAWSATAAPPADTGAEAQVTDVPAEVDHPTESDVPAVKRKPAGRARPTPPADPEPGDAVGIGPWLLAGAACLAAVCAGVSASVTGLTLLLIPFAVAGLALGATALFGFVGRGAAPLELAVPGLPTAGCALLLLAALLAPDFLSPQYEASRQRPQDDPTALRAVPLSGDLVPPDQLGSPDAGVDATRFALQRSGVRVRVLSASAGPLRLEGKKPTFTKERYLAVELAIQHLGSAGAITVVPWGSSAPRAVPNVRLAVGGKPLAPADPGPAAGLGRLTGETALPPGGAVTARLLFPDDPLADWLVLDLPAEAWGQSGAFRFRIPKSMVAAAPAARAK